MTEKDLPSLIAEQRHLIIEKSVILDLLRKVRDEMHKLQVIYSIITMVGGTMNLLVLVTHQIAWIRVLYAPNPAARF